MMAEIVRGAQDFLGLFDRVLHLARDEQARERDVLIVVFLARESDAKLVVVRRRRVKGLDWSRKGSVSRPDWQYEGSRLGGRTIGGFGARCLLTGRLSSEAGLPVPRYTPRLGASAALSARG